MKLIRDLVQYRHLLLMLTWRDIKIRYKQSLMGFLWAILMPVLIVSAGIIVKKAYSMASGQALDIREVLSITIKSLPWAFFVAAIRFATGSLTNNHNLVTKIYFPREVFPLAAVLANLVDFGVATLVLIPLLFFARSGFTLYLLWVPVLLTLLLLLTVGLAFFLSCTNLFFRDVKYLVEVFLTFGIFFTPVFYDARALGKWAPLVLLNPLGPLLQALNDVIVIHRPPDIPWIAYSGFWAIGGLSLAWIIFNKAESAFAESI